MTPQPQKDVPQKNNIQINLNTLLLTICVGLSTWGLKSINDLQKQLSGLVPVVSNNGSAIIGINAVNAEQTNKIDELSNRLTKVETIQSDQFKIKN